MSRLDAFCAKRNPSRSWTDSIADSLAAIKGDLGGETGVLVSHDGCVIKWPVEVAGASPSVSVSVTALDPGAVSLGPTQETIAGLIPLTAAICVLSLERVKLVRRRQCSAAGSSPEVVVSYSVYIHSDESARMEELLKTAASLSSARPGTPIPVPVFIVGTFMDELTDVSALAVRAVLAELSSLCQNIKARVRLPIEVVSVSAVDLPRRSCVLENSASGGANHSVNSGPVSLSRLFETMCLRGSVPSVTLGSDSTSASPVVDALAVLAARSPPPLFILACDVRRQLFTEGAIMAAEELAGRLACLSATRADINVLRVPPSAAAAAQPVASAGGDPPLLVTLTTHENVVCVNLLYSFIGASQHQCVAVPALAELIARGSTKEHRPLLCHGFVPLPLVSAIVEATAHLVSHATHLGDDEESRLKCLCSLYEVLLLGCFVQVCPHPGGSVLEGYYFPSLARGLAPLPPAALAIAETLSVVMRVVGRRGRGCGRASAVHLHAERVSVPFGHSVSSSFFPALTCALGNALVGVPLSDALWLKPTRAHEGTLVRGLIHIRENGSAATAARTELDIIVLGMGKSVETEMETILCLQETLESFTFVTGTRFPELVSVVTTSSEESEARLPPRVTPELLFTRLNDSLTAPHGGMVFL